MIDSTIEDKKEIAVDPSTLAITVFSNYSSRFVEVPYSDKIDVSSGDKVVFKDEEDREEIGTIIRVGIKPNDPERFLKNSKILRKTTPNDIQRFESYELQSKSALASCKKLITKHGLDMQVFKSKYSFDGSRVLFMFTADERIDFRDLVKDLAKILQKQIYLRQIGPRDKAKHVGGYGKCGRTLCCNTFLNKFDSITMEMVRTQSLESKGSSKLSGVCGKLLCCLKYEVEAYKSLKSSLPSIGTIVKFKKSSGAPEKEGEVIALDVLNKKFKVAFRENDFMIFTPDDIEISAQIRSPVKDATLHNKDLNN